MKFRAGFVSNSSSSSFIVALDRVPGSVEEVQELFFGDAETVYYEYAVTEPRTARQASEILYRDIVNGVITEGPEQDNPEYSPLRVITVEEAMGGRHGDGPLAISIPDKIMAITMFGVSYIVGQNEDGPDFNDSDWGKKLYFFHKDLVEKFIAQNPGKIFARLEYSDNDGEADLEHGNAFDRVPTIRVNRH